MKLLIFDIDGTLIDLNRYDGNYFEDTIQMLYGVSGIDKNWRQYKNATDYGILHEIIKDKFGRELEMEEFLEFESRLEEIYISRGGQTGVHPLTGANDFIEAVKDDEGIKLGIATGNSRKIAELKLTHAFFDKDVFTISSSNDSMERERILKSCEVKSKEKHAVDSFDRVIYFGDRVWDLKAALSVNYDFIGIGKDVHELKEQGVKDCLNVFNTDELMKII